MKMDTLRRTLILPLLVMGALPLVLGAGSPRKSASNQDSEAHHEQPGVESPEALIAKYLMSIARGEPAKTASCFDRSTAAGKTQSDAMQSLSRAIGTYHAARRMANMKFGAAGVTVVESECKIGFLPEYTDPAKMQKLIDKKIEIIRQDSGKAVARPFGDNIPMHLKDGRWYMTPNADEFDLFPLLALSKLWGDSFDQIPGCVEQSKSSEELRQRIRKAVDRRRAAFNAEILRLEKSLREAAERDERNGGHSDARGDK